MRLPHQVECWVFRKQGETIEFLLLKRISEKGGFWQPITGGIESRDKNNVEACYRELLEEANIAKSDVKNRIEEFYCFEFEYQDKDDQKKISKEYCYGFEVASDFNVIIDHNPHSEHEEAKWASVEEALALLKWQDNKDALLVLSKKL